MLATWKTVRVFISSTFHDMQAERDHLVRFVFPRLHEELLPRRIHLVDVDLRWGVTSEQDSSEVCREIINECRPRFLCILGGRYGTIPEGNELSITADEVHFGVLEAQHEKIYALFYFRDGAVTELMDKSSPGSIREPRHSDKAVKLARLKRDIRKAKHQPFLYRPRWNADEEHLLDLEVFGHRVERDILATIDDEFGVQPPAQLDEFDEENAAMEAFVEERSERFVLGSRETVLEELLAHASATDGNGYVCLIGAPGSGKSALLAHLSRHPTLNAQASTLLIRHFVGASPGSTDVRRTLRRLCHELKADCPYITADIPDDPEKLRVAFPDFLRQACARQRVVILLDAVNQFDPASHSAGLHWLPEELADNARVILSALDGAALEELRRRPRKPREIELKPLTVDDGEAIIEQFRKRYRKKFEPGQRAALLDKTDAGTPLYLLAALEELRTLGTYEEITRRIAELPPTTHELFVWILERLENDDGFRGASGRRVGHELVSSFAALVGASRHGLSQRELADLLDAGDPQGNVAALLRLLRPYLMRRGELVDFYHAQFRAAAEKAWLKTDAQRQAAHTELAGYFRGIAIEEDGDLPKWRPDATRGLAELPYHELRGGLWDDLTFTLSDPLFLQAKCECPSLNIDSLLGDFRDLQSGEDALRLSSSLSKEQLDMLVFLHQALWADAACLRSHPTLVIQQLWNHMQSPPQGSWNLRNRLAAVVGELRSAGRLILAAQVPVRASHAFTTQAFDVGSRPLSVAVCPQGLLAFTEFDWCLIDTDGGVRRRGPTTLGAIGALRANANFCVAIVGSHILLWKGLPENTPFRFSPGWNPSALGLANASDRLLVTGTQGEWVVYSLDVEIPARECWGRVQARATAGSLGPTGPFFIGGDDGSVWRCDNKQSTRIGQWPASVRALDVSPDASRILVVLGNGQLLILDKRGRETFRSDLHYSITDGAFESAGNSAVAVTADGACLRIRESAATWRAESICTLPAALSWIRPLADDQSLALLADDGVFRVLRGTAAGSLAPSTLEEEPEIVTRGVAGVLPLADDGTHLIATTSGELWQFACGPIPSVWKLMHRGDRVRALHQISTDVGLLVFHAKQHSYLAQLDMRAAEPRIESLGPSEGHSQYELTPVGSAVSPCGELALTLSRSVEGPHRTKVVLYRTRNWSKYREWWLDGLHIQAVLSDTGLVILAPYVGGRPKVLNAADSSENNLPTGDLPVALSSEGSRLLAIDGAGTAWLLTKPWNAGRRYELRPRITTGTLSRDGTIGVLVADEGFVYVFRVDDSAILQGIEWRGGFPLRWLPTGCVLDTERGEIRLWGARGFQILRWK